MSVSVIIPVYNQERTICRAIESALVQRNADIEIIVINDGSCDRTGEIVKKYENQVRIINHSRRLGPYYSRFEGIMVASGEWMTFIDGDDAIDPSSIADCLATSEATKTDIVQMRIKRRYGHWNLTTGLRHQRYDIDKALDSVLYDYRLFPVQCWGKLYKSSLLEPMIDNHITYHGMWGEDRLFNLQIFAKSPRISICDSAKYMYSWGGFTSRQDDCLADYVTVDSLKRKFLNDMGIMTDKISQLMKKELINTIHYGTRQLINARRNRKEVINALTNCGLDYSDYETNICPNAIYRQSKNSMSRIIKRLIRKLL